MPTMRRLLVLLAVSAAVSAAVAACGRDDSPNGPLPPDPPEGQLPDFSALDVNPTSATFEQQVSPRDFLGVVSGYYFGRAT